MTRAVASPPIDLWKLFATSIPRAPWKGFVFGLFLPLIVMQIGGALHKDILGVVVALGLCTVFFVVDSWRTKQLSVFPLMTFFMTATQFAAGMYAYRHAEWKMASTVVPLIDNAAVAVLFLGSLLTRTPLILAMLDRDTLEVIPEKIRQSSYYLKAWRLVTWLWGLLYVVQVFILAILFYHHLPGAEAVDYLLGWPIVAVFLVLSVMLPRWYWTVNMPRIDQEHGQTAQIPTA